VNSIAVIDIVFAALIIILMIRSALRGFVGELLSMASLVLGALAAVFFYKNGAALIRTKIFAEVRFLPEILAFAALFLIVFLVIKVLESILKDIIERINLGGLDRFLGVVFGFFEGLLAVALILLALSVQPLFAPEGLLRGSVFAELLLPLISPLPSLLPGQIPAADGHV
jgi:membrane protein required for colicin V production